MKTNFRKITSDFSDFLEKMLSDIKDLKQNRPTTFLSILAGTGLLILACMAFTFYLATIGQQEPVVMPKMLATTTMDPMRQAAATPTPTFLPTTTPIPSNLWKVLEIVGKETISGRTALVVNFMNTSTGETKKGQCQSPHDPAPKVGDIFVAEVKDGYVLLSPVIAGTSQIDLLSKTQRFIFIP